MELTYTDIIYLVFALTKVLQTDMSRIDQAHCESLLYRLLVCEKGEKIRKEFKAGKPINGREWLNERNTETDN